MLSVQDAFPPNTEHCLDGRITRNSEHLVAAGGFADVWEGIFDRQKVAIKVIRPFESSGVKMEQMKLLRRLWREYLVWSSLSHANILQCLGYSYDFSPAAYVLPSLISPWMAGGTVTSYLKSHPNADRLRMLVGIAEGLSYLHSRMPAIVHGDLRAGNVLVSDSGVPCLTDFGLSRVLDETRGMTTSSELAGSVRWMSPELFRTDSVTVYSDVWAYGMTTLEILSGERPYAGVKRDVFVHISIRDGELPERPRDLKMLRALSDQMWSICQSCWFSDPTQRPSMQDVTDLMKILATPAEALKYQPMDDLRSDQLDSSISSNNSARHADSTKEGSDAVLATYLGMKIRNGFPPSMVKEGPDWFVVFTKSAPLRKIDINLVRILQNENNAKFSRISISADGKYLATGCDRSTHIYDTKTGTKICSFVTAASLVQSLCFSPNGELLAVGSDDGCIRVWEVASRGALKYFEGYTGGVYAIRFSKDGLLLVSGTYLGTVQIWDMATNVTKFLAIAEDDTCIAISPDGRLVATGSPDGSVRLWDAQTSALIERLVGHAGSVSSVAFTPDGKGVVSGSMDKTLKCWELDMFGNPQLGTPLGHLGKTLGIIPPNGQGSKESRYVGDYTGHRDAILTAAISDDGQWVVSSSRDGCVQFWDLDKLRPKAQLFLKGNASPMISVDLSPAGDMFATRSHDGSVRLWSYKVW